MQLGQKEPIHWCRKTPRSGNPMALHRKGISPGGNVCDISMATGKTITNRMGNLYMQLQEYAKPLRGWVWYHECDTCEDVPSREKVESSGKALEDLGLCDKCLAREQLIYMRQDAKTALGEEYSAQFQTQMDKLTQTLERVAAANNSTERIVLSDEQLAKHLEENVPAPKATRKTRLRTDKEVNADG